MGGITMNERDFPNTKTIIKRSLILWGVIFAIITLAVGINYCKSYISWKSIFEITYIGTMENYDEKSYGREYTIYNATNEVYDIETIYIEVSDAHKTYKIPYEVHITLQPHETEDFILLYKNIGEFFGKDTYSCNPVIKGLKYNKK